MMSVELVSFSGDAGKTKLTRWILRLDGPGTPSDLLNR